MSLKERDRLQIIEAVREKRLKQRTAAERLGLSVRQVKRLAQAHRTQGVMGLLAKRRGQPSRRRIAEAERDRVVALVRERYADFGPTLAAEYLRARRGFVHSVETLRPWMMQAELWAAKRQRRKRPFQLRERRACVGELVQIDGSPHAWLETRGPRCTLIAFVDDATSQLQYARFERSETTRAYLQGLRAYVGCHGRPVALYSDRHSIFTKHDPEDPLPTQFERAARALEIEPILARSPQAKGRVERSFQTPQDRLVKALRLAGIATIEAANAFLPDFITDHNTRFAKTPRQATNAHRPLHMSADLLHWITGEQQPRTLSKSLSCQYRGKQYLIQTNGAPPISYAALASLSATMVSTIASYCRIKTRRCPTRYLSAMTCQSASPTTKPSMRKSREPSVVKPRRDRFRRRLTSPGAKPAKHRSRRMRRLFLRAAESCINL